MKLLIAATLFSSMTMADDPQQNCSLQLQDDLLVQRGDVQLLRNDRQLWRISSQGELWVNDQVVNTDAQTTIML